MKKFIYISLTLLFGLHQLTSAQQKLTLQECIDIALQNNRNIKEQQLNKQQREIAYNQARADLLPGVNASIGQSFVFGRSIGLDNTYQNTNSSQTSFNLSGDITLFDGLRMKHNIDARRAELYASQADMEKVEDDIIMSVSTAFLQVLLNKELLQIAERQVELTKENIKHRTELVHSGKLAQGELYELEAQQAKEELNLIEAQNRLKLSLLDLAQIMEIENFAALDVIAPDEKTLAAETDVLLSAEATYQGALLHRPELKSAQFQMNRFEKEVKIAQSEYFPTLSFGANIGTGYYHMNQLENRPFAEQFKNNMSNSLGFSLRIPIFNRLRVRNNVKNAKIALENSRLQMDKTKLELRKRVEQAYYNAVAAKSRWSAAMKSEKASKEAYRFAQQKYENGRATAYELFQAKNNVAQILAEQAQAKYEYLFRLKILEILKN